MRFSFKKLKKYTATKVLIARPHSIRFAHIIPGFLQPFAKKCDSLLRSWALSQSVDFGANEWNKLQFLKLKNMLKEAMSDTVYWKEMFLKIGFDPGELSQLEDLHKLPIIDRASLKVIPLNNLTSLSASSSRLFPDHTSGSSGEPLKFFLDEEVIFCRRVWTLHRALRDSRGNTPRILILGLSRRPHLNGLGLRFEGQKLENLIERLLLYQNIQQFKPNMLFTSPSFLRRFAFYCREDDFSPGFFYAIRYVGEEFDQEERRSLESFFNCPIYGTYGTNECSLIAEQCENYNYHVAGSMNYIEVIDSATGRELYGQEGDVVITSLGNIGMPFIRYKIGDRGIFKDGANCDCGDILPILEFRGRDVGYLKLPNGTVYPVFYILNYLSTNFSSSIRRFQIKQSGAQITLDYILSPDSDPKAVRQKLFDYFKETIGEDIVLCAVNYIVPSPSGKTPFLVRSTASEGAF